MTSDFFFFKSIVFKFVSIMYLKCSVPLDCELQLYFVRSMNNLFATWKLEPVVAYNFLAVHSLHLPETNFYPVCIWTWCRFQLFAVCSQNFFCCLEIWTWTFKSSTYCFQVKYSQIPSLTHPSRFWTIAPEELTCDQSEKVLYTGQCDQDIVPVCSTQNVRVTF